LATRISLLRWLLIPVFALLSLALTAWVRPGTPNWMAGAPGMVFFMLNIVQVLLKFWGKRMQRNNPARWGSPRA